MCMLPQPLVSKVHSPFSIPRSGINDMYSASQRTLDAEQKLRQQLEQEIETQKSIRQEKEVSAV